MKASRQLPATEDATKKWLQFLRDDVEALANKSKVMTLSVTTNQPTRIQTGNNVVGAVIVNTGGIEVTSTTITIGANNNLEITVKSSQTTTATMTFQIIGA